MNEFLPQKHYPFRRWRPNVFNADEPADRIEKSAFCTLSARRRFPDQSIGGSINWWRSVQALACSKYSDLTKIEFVYGSTYLCQTCAKYITYMHINARSCISALI